MSGRHLSDRDGDRPLRVLHCPSLIGGNPGQLARAERELGLDSRAVALIPSPYAFEADEILAPAGAGFARRESARLGLLWRALRWADVVHFNFGSTVMPRRADPSSGLRAAAWRAYAAMLDGRDLPLLRRAGKVIAMTYQGNDARQRDVSLARYDVSIAREVGPAYYPPGSDERKRAEIERIDRSADLIYALNPDLLAVLPERARFLSYANVDPAGIEPRPPNDPSAAPVVAHAPTNRDAKGTRFVLAALERLREEGVAFELRLIEGVGNREARELLSTSDLRRGPAARGLVRRRGERGDGARPRSRRLHPAGGPGARAGRATQAAARDLRHARHDRAGAARVADVAPSGAARGRRARTRVRGVLARPPRRRREPEA